MSLGSRRETYSECCKLTLSLSTSDIGAVSEVKESMSLIAKEAYPLRLLTLKVDMEGKKVPSRLIPALGGALGLGAQS